MKTLYYFQPMKSGNSGLLSWQKTCLAVAREGEACLFTREGIDELADRLQALADGLKGKDRKVSRPDWDFCEQYHLGPSISIGYGCSVSFSEVSGCWKEDEAKMTVSEKLAKCREILLGITRSGFIPFASPAPSSTESELKRTILKALRCVELSEALHESLYGGRVEA